MSKAFCPKCGIEIDNVRIEEIKGDVANITKAYIDCDKCNSLTIVRTVDK